MFKQSRWLWIFSQNTMVPVYKNANHLAICIATWPSRIAWYLLPPPFSSTHPLFPYLHLKYPLFPLRSLFCPFPPPSLSPLCRFLIYLMIYLVSRDIIVKKSLSSLLNPLTTPPLPLTLLFPAISISVDLRCSLSLFSRHIRVNKAIERGVLTIQGQLFSTKGECYHFPRQTAAKTSCPFIINRMRENEGKMMSRSIFLVVYSL